MVDILIHPDPNYRPLEETLENEAVFPFRAIKTAVLGESYELGLNFVSSIEIKSLNHEWRAQDKPTDILSFGYSDNNGDLFICLAVAGTKAPLYERSLENFILFLYVHGLHHLKGFDHGDEMEMAENKIRQQFRL